MSWSWDQLSWSAWARCENVTLSLSRRGEKVWKGYDIWERKDRQMDWQTKSDLELDAQPENKSMSNIHYFPPNPQISCGRGGILFWLSYFLWLSSWDPMKGPHCAAVLNFLVRHRKFSFIHFRRTSFFALSILPYEPIIQLSEHTQAFSQSSQSNVDNFLKFTLKDSTKLAPCLWKRCLFK